jgi:hypothetical protein
VRIACRLIPVHYSISPCTISPTFLFLHHIIPSSRRAVLPGACTFSGRAVLISQMRLTPSVPCSDSPSPLGVDGSPQACTGCASGLFIQRLGKRMVVRRCGVGSCVSPDDASGPDGAVCGVAGSGGSRGAFGSVSGSRTCSGAGWTTGTSASSCYRRVSLSVGGGRPSSKNTMSYTRYPPPTYLHATNKHIVALLSSFFSRSLGSTMVHGTPNARK